MRENMKTAIIYGTTTGTSRKIAKIIASKLKGEVITIPVSKAKDTCLLKYDFIIIGGSIHSGRIQSSIKSYVSRNSKTLKGINYGLYLSCLSETKGEKYLMDSFGEDIVDAAFIADTFGGELNPNEGSYITRQKTKRIIKKWKNKGRIPEIKMERIEHFTNEINNKIKK